MPKITKVKKAIEPGTVVVAALVVVRTAIEASHAIIAGSKKLWREIRQLGK